LVRDNLTMSGFPLIRDSSSAITKENLKYFLRYNRTAYKAAEVLYENALLVRHIVEQRLGGVALGRQSGSSIEHARQPVMTWDVRLSASGRSEHLIDGLRARGIRVSEGGHTFYIPPQDALNKVIPRVVAFYPKAVGFKVLKDARHPLEARYLYKHRRSLQLLRRLIGTPQDQLIVANYMYLLGLSPRVWDLTCWENEGTRHTVFVVDHVAGSRPTIEQCMSFRQCLKKLNQDSRLRILIPEWEKDADFLPPDCNSNLIYATALNRAQYVDFQNFTVRGRASWSREIAARSVSNKDRSRLNHGSESTNRTPSWLVRSELKDDKRWSFVVGALRQCLPALAERIVLHVGCGIGTTLHAALLAGAAWSIGWDRADVVADAQEFLVAIGTTRFTLIGADLDRIGQLESDVPGHLRHHLTGAVVFYSAGRQRIDSLRSLSTLPWDALVYEGGPTERADDIVRRLERLLKSDLHVVAACEAGGGGHAGPIIVVRHKSVLPA
jgi:hypothetical protein